MSSTNRITGMFSGMDTESLISSLVEAKKTKVTKVTKKQMKIKYQQDAWTDLNKKLKSFQSSLSNLRFQGSYMKKKTTASDASAATVTTSDDAMLGTQSLKIKSLAQTGYMTGAEISKEDGSKITNGTKLTDLGIEAGSKISITTSGGAKDIEITEDMTMNGLVDQLKSAGVTAKFDSSTQRLFISSSTSGKKADFNISAADGSNANDTNALMKLGLQKAPEGLTPEQIKEGGYAVKNDGTDAEIVLNGAIFTSTTNNFNVNGLAITANKVTGDQEVTLNTSRDTSAMYDMIKNIVKEYSELVNEMDKLYGADTKTKYDPLTDEEKSAMSDYEIEQWEDKLKEQVLAGDTTIRSITSKLQESIDKGFTVNGKTMHLFDLGIEAAGYFDAADGEKHALHIKGDKDDDTYKSEDNKLEYLISSDPDAVSSFFSQLINDMYESMNDMSSRQPNSRSFGSFYEDVKMKDDYKSYNSKISDMEEKLTAYEDKWYAKFAKMEKAMSKMQSNQNAVASMVGNNW